MKKSTISDETLQQQFQAQVAALWPVLKGSVAQIRKSCIRPHCPVCARGEKHEAYILSFTHRGRRRCLYVPVDLVPLLRRGIKNGRRLEQILYQLGLALLRDYRRRRDALPHDSGSRKRRAV